MLTVEGHGKRHPQRIANAPAYQPLHGAAGFQDALGRHAGLGHAQVQRRLRPRRSELLVHLHDFFRIGIFERHAVARESQPIEQLAVRVRAFEHWPEPIVGRELRPGRRIDRSAIDAHPHGDVMLDGQLDQEAHLVLPRALRLVVIQVARVVADLVDPGGHLGGDAIVLL